MRNTIFSVVLGGLLALGASTAVYGQDNVASAQNQPSQTQQGNWRHGHRPMNPDRQLQHMTKRLNLSADQQSQIRPALVDRQQRMEALRQDQSLSPQDRHQKMQAIQQDTRSKIEAVLNDQQKQQFDAMQQHMREHQRGMNAGMNDPPTSSPQPR
jgi:protein CpxP